MLGRLLARLLGRKEATSSPVESRPVSPPPPLVPAAPPPPPPPPPIQTIPAPAPEPSVQAPSATNPGPEDAFPQPTLESGLGAGGVRLILEDGTLASPSLDPDLEERLRYIVDNIVPPSERPPK